MTLDEAIKHCLEVAEKYETQADKWQEEGGEQWGKTTACRECAADHRQLAEWLQELRATRHYINKICEELAELYGSPCNYSPQDEYMLENGSCEDCCGDISDKDCWARYFHRKFNLEVGE
jgi:hypothetical protein